MSISYDTITSAFLAKITEYEFLSIPDSRMEIIDGYMKRAVVAFKNICKYDLLSVADDEIREYVADIPESEVYEIVDIISEGMVVQWLKSYVYNQDLLENALNTRDFTTYSPAELLHRVGEIYKETQKDYTQLIREYSYNNGNLGDLHL